ncbi:DUF5610 domain-containing protein [Haliovirga abyssi]|uniref:DUF5610 domain-containing protein n=1 Tax=Haliovirga abyssi TaxID=2996794 RepID=A0AAU9DGN7_9FUSO|nr:DUF5610 domain-containing protein [Haliovirga abyssi]BDU49859.1 hypothetical protein HLVA_04280 [Haliovirga abyssi]
MSNINSLNSTQIDTLLKSTELKGGDKSSNNEKEDISNFTKKDFLDISNQIDIINQQNSKVNKKYSDLEKKLGIDSNKWGVDAVSDDIFNFAKIVYDKYKINHSEEESQKVLDDFYNLAKKSITQGYNEAKDFLGAVSEDVAALGKATYDRTIEKLDNWYKNGGVESTDKTEENKTENSETNKIKNKNTEETKKTYEDYDKKTKQMLKESEIIKNQVVELLKQSGLYAKETETKKSTIDYEG